MSDTRDSGGGGREKRGRAEESARKNGTWRQRSALLVSPRRFGSPNRVSTTSELALTAQDRLRDVVRGHDSSSSAKRARNSLGSSRSGQGRTKPCREIFPLLASSSGNRIGLEVRLVNEACEWMRGSTQSETSRVWGRRKKGGTIHAPREVGLSHLRCTARAPWQGGRASQPLNAEMLPEASAGGMWRVEVGLKKVLSSGGIKAEAEVNLYISRVEHPVPSCGVA